MKTLKETSHKNYLILISDIDKNGYYKGKVYTQHLNNTTHTNKTTTYGLTPEETEELCKQWIAAETRQEEIRNHNNFIVDPWKTVLISGNDLFDRFYTSSDNLEKDMTHFDKTFRNNQRNINGTYYYFTNAARAIELDFNSIAYDSDRGTILNSYIYAYKNKEITK